MQERVQRLETEVADLTEEVELLSSGLSALQEHVTRLERKAERVARAARSSESVSSGSPGYPEGRLGEGQEAPATPAREPTFRSPSRASAGSGTQSVPSWLQREAICDQIGQFLLRALSGDHRSSSGRDLISLASRIWVVVQDYEGNRYNPVKAFRSWSPAKALVKVGNDAGDSIFVGLPSEREARRVVHSATLEWPSEQ